MLMLACAYTRCLSCAHSCCRAARPVHLQCARASSSPLLGAEGAAPTTTFRGWGALWAVGRGGLGFRDGHALTGLSAPSWLYKEATVQQVDVLPEAGAAHVKVIISNSAYGKFRKLFPG